MKIFGVFRGFPGLGRAVSGIEIMRKFKEEHSCDTKIFTYMQGIELAKKNGFDCELKDEAIEKETITSIGVNPVSKLGSKLLMHIINYNPDLVIMDGEPLLTHALALSFHRDRIVSLLNPYDLENPHLPVSSINYFRNCFMNAGTMVVHGLWKIERPESYTGDYYSIGTILRKDILDLRKVEKPGEDIICILGGGTQNASEGFFGTTVQIGKKIMQLADIMKSKNIRIYANDNSIAKELLKNGKPSNITVYDEFVEPKEMYKNAGVVICRAGRNSTSELLYLKIPAILVATGNDFRAKEQEANIEKMCKIGCGQIHKLSYTDSVEKYVDKINAIMDVIYENNEFESGNTHIIEILAKRMEISYGRSNY